MSENTYIEEQALWWQDLQVPVGRTLECRIGPLHLHMQHLQREWRLAEYRNEEEAGPVPPVQLAISDDSITHEETERFVTPSADNHIRFVPVLPDRSVVVRPRQPFYLSSGAETVLYLSTPVWLRIGIGETVTLKEVATVQLSDTWFGPSTREGELCYSDKTHARNSRSEVPYRPHRVVTPVRIHNQAATVLPLEKLSLPVVQLSVYGARDGSLHTQGVSLTRTGDSDMATVKVDDGPHDYDGELQLITEPRMQDRGGLVRAFSVLFGN